MQRLRIPLLLAIWISIGSYTGLSYVWGPTGERAMKYLVEQKQNLEKNIEELSAHGTVLQQQVLSLLYDAETLKEYARNLGYGKPHEKFIRIQGKGPLQAQTYPIGTFIRIQPPPTLSHEQILLFSCLLGGGAFVILVVFSSVSHSVSHKRRLSSRP
ncbi:MAG: septum formation initiator family protein [Treponemataceae bacterium]|nr:septum formation initiator family protein [Treponemataceae bacterium]